MALLIPYSLFEGRLTFRRDNTTVIDPELKAFSLYLKQLIDSKQLSFQFDLSSFEFDISQAYFSIRLFLKVMALEVPVPWLQQSLIATSKKIMKI